MIKQGEKKTASKTPSIKKVLITQPKPEGEKSPYFDLAKKHNIELQFHPFIIVEGIPAKEFRRQKIEIANYTAVIFTSRNAIDHFFRICEEIKVNISQDTKYFCITEAVALYLQKFFVVFMLIDNVEKTFVGAVGPVKYFSFPVENKFLEV